MNLELFPKDDLRVVALSGDDVRRRSDALRDFARVVLDSEEMYPGIRTWLDDKVLPQLGCPRRMAFVAYEGERPAASAVLKVGAEAKICHLNVKSAWQGQHLGELFFVLMALHARRAARSLHFTLPESLWVHKRAFFEAFGFKGAQRSVTQYRARDTELVCSASIGTVVAQAEAKIPKLSDYFTLAGRELAASVLMSVRPAFAHALMSGRKCVEVRRRFSKRWEGARAVLYATQPAGVLLGEVTIRRVTHAAPTRLWREFGAMMGCTEAEFLAYAGDVPQAAAIEVEHPRPYWSPIPLVQLERWLGEVPRPPQSYVAVDAGDRWGQALAMATLLNGGFAVRPGSAAGQAAVA